MDPEVLTAAREYLLDNIPRSAGRFSKNQGLVGVPDLGFQALVSDAVDEMRSRRPFAEGAPKGLGIGPQTQTESQGLNGETKAPRRGRKLLETLPLHPFEVLCYEICNEIQRRCASAEDVKLTTDQKIKQNALPMANPPPANQQSRRWQVLNAAEDDYTLSDSSDDDYECDDDTPLPSPHLTDIESESEEHSAELDLVCTRLMAIFQDRSRYKLLLGYRDLEAQAILNLLQNLLDSPRVKSSKLKKELVVAIQRLSKKSALYPECFVLKDILIDKNPDGSIHALSSGKFGEVWKGALRGQDVCLKVMRVYRDSKIHELLKTFSCEAVLWSQLQHSNVLPFYGVYRLGSPSRDRICLVSPWMNNGNVDEFLVKKPDADRIALAADIAAGLRYLHANNVIHGDLKGANVLVDSSGRACLADFGLSTLRDPEVLALTSTNSIVCGGTIRWMAPELLSPHDYDEPFNTPESDVYAFAGVSYEIFTGHVPFYEVFRDQTVVVKVTRGERPSRPDQAVFTSSGLTESIWKLMQDCWLTDPEERPLASDIEFRLAVIQKAVAKAKVTPRDNSTSGRSTPRPGDPHATGQKRVLLSPPSFRATFAQAANLENQLRRKELLRLLEISTVPLLGEPASVPQ